MTSYILHNSSDKLSPSSLVAHVYPVLLSVHQIRVILVSLPVLQQWPHGAFDRHLIQMANVLIIPVISQLLPWHALLASQSPLYRLRNSPDQMQYPWQQFQRIIGALDIGKQPLLDYVRRESLLASLSSINESHQFAPHLKSVVISHSTIESLSTYLIPYVRQPQETYQPAHEN